MAVIDGQIMHGSSRSLLVKKPEGFFRQSQTPPSLRTGGFFIWMILFYRHYLLAMTSISTIAPLGRSFTAKQARAGLLVGK